jgi:hypothetical protein
MVYNEERKGAILVNSLKIPLVFFITLALAVCPK